MSTVDKKKVAIVGGGAGGLCTALELIKRGYEVEIYEADSNVGGKITSYINPLYQYPGEHGFHIFAGYYHNLFDTLRQIPQNGKNVFENLEAAKEVMLTLGSNRIKIPVQFPTSLKDLIHSMVTALKVIFHKILTIKELILIIKKFWILQISCKNRRLQQWDNTSWWDFFDLEHQRPEFQTLLGWSASQDLIAVDPHEVSTRMIGYGLLQFLYCLIIPGHGAGDRVLNGPAKSQMIDPWVAHLQQLGVKINVNNRLYNLDYDNATNSIRSMQVLNTETQELLNVKADQFVLAIPLDSLIPYIRNLKAFETVVSGWDRKILQTKWMSGIQMYLKNDIKIVHGQVSVSNSPYSTSFISQNQFWATNCKMSNYGDHKAKGIISIVIANWEKAGQFNGIRAKDCTSAEEVVREAWKEIRFRFPEFPDFNDPAVLGWNLDPGIQFSRGRAENLKPLFAVTKGSWPYRPEAYTDIKNLKLAADFVRTSAMSATMEGANEAGRRAVNAILNDDQRADLCKVYDFYEPELFKFFQVIDEYRWEHGLPPMELELDESFIESPDFLGAEIQIHQDTGTVILKTKKN